MNPSTTPRHASAGRAGGVFSLAYGLVSYFLFGASFCVYWIAFLADRWVPITVNHRPGDALPPWAAVAVDLGLVLLFGLQHSVMARPGFKRWWTRIVPAGLERSTYVLLASLFLALLMAAWQPLPEILWQVDAAAGRALLWTLFALGLPVCVVASFQIDHFDLLGLRQAWAHFRDRPYTPPQFVQPWLYRVVRHPIQLGVLLMLWPLPTMTVGHLLLATSMTGYMLIGLYFEERDLIAAFGERYREYRYRVPGLIPGLAFPARLLPPRRQRQGRAEAGRAPVRGGRSAPRTPRSPRSRTGPGLGTEGRPSRPPGAHVRVEW
jgi:protein-S-isoprenylcysteine O-methyltransferase Ste14